jgi:hypothetical protein
VPDDPHHLVAALGRRAREHLADGDVVAAHDASATAITRLDGLDDRGIDAALRIATWRTHADVLVAAGRFEHAIWVRHRLVRELTPGVHDTVGAEHRRLLVACLRELADVHLASGRPASAHAALRTALGQLRAVAPIDLTGADRWQLSELERRVEALDEDLDPHPIAPVTQLGVRPQPPSRMRSLWRGFRRREPQAR